MLNALQLERGWSLTQHSKRAGWVLPFPAGSVSEVQMLKLQRAGRAGSLRSQTMQFCSEDPGVVWETCTTAQVSNSFGKLKPNLKIARDDICSQRPFTLFRFVHRNSMEQVSLLDHLQWKI